MEILLRDDKNQTVFENRNGLTFSDSPFRKHMLAPDCKGNFDLACTDVPNVVYVSDSGEIIRLEKLGEGWKKTVILTSKSGTMDVFGIRLIVSEGELNLIYGLRHNSENMIVHQTFSENKPQVVQSAFGEVFFVMRDETGCIYLVCEAAEGVWHLSVCRGGVWSRPEELMSGCGLLDIIPTGYKSFCTVTETDGTVTFRNGNDSFEIFGEKPAIVRTGTEFSVITRDNGQVFYTDCKGRHKIISSSDIREFYLRHPESGEYFICNRCFGNLVQGKPRLFLIDNMQPQKGTVGETVRLELTKQIIALEARVAKLEEKISDFQG